MFEGDVLADGVAHEREQVPSIDRKSTAIGLQDLAAAEREQLLRERRGVLGGAPDLQRLIANRRFRRRVLLDHARVAQDRRQHVVEVVRHAAGELADRLHLLRFGQPPLEGALLQLQLPFAARNQPAGERHGDQQHRRQGELRRSPTDGSGPRRRYRRRTRRPARIRWRHRSLAHAWMRRPSASSRITVP